MRKSFRTADRGPTCRIPIFRRVNSFRQWRLGRLLIRVIVRPTGWRSLVRGLARRSRRAGSVGYSGATDDNSLVMARLLLLYRSVIYWL